MKKIDLYETERIENIYKNYLDDERFNKKWSLDNEGNKQIEKQKFDLVNRFVRSTYEELNNLKVIEIGCSSGNMINILKKVGINDKNIFGIDIRSERLKLTKKKYPRSNIITMNATNITFGNDSFDIITVFTLFSSIIDPDIRKNIAEEIIRILKPGGVILFYDVRYNNPFNKNLVAIRMREIKKLFPKMQFKVERVTILPPLVRMLGKANSHLYKYLSSINFLNTHYFIKIKNNDD